MAPTSLPILRRKRRDLLKAFKAKLKRMDIRFQLFQARYAVAIEEFTHANNQLNIDISAGEALAARLRKERYEQFAKDMDAKIEAYKASERAIVKE